MLKLPFALVIVLAAQSIIGDPVDSKQSMKQSFRERFEAIKTSSHYKTEVFLLAHDIKEVLDKATESKEVLADLNELKAEFPVTVRYIVWGDKVALYTKRYNEYLYPYYQAEEFKDGTRRWVYTWRHQSSAEHEGYWEFDSPDGKTFSMKNVHFDEFLYAVNTKYDRDSSLRNVATWRPPCDDTTCFWQLEYMGDNEIRIMNAEYHEYLVAGGDSLAHDSDRRNIFAGKLTDDDRIWKVVLAK